MVTPHVRIASAVHLEQTPKESVDPRAANRRPAAICLLALTLVVAGLHAVWLAIDRAPMGHSDSYGYLSRLVAFVHQIPTIRGPLELDISLTALSVYGRPPLYQLATVPLIWLGDGAQDAAVAINFFGLALLAVCLFQLGLSLSGPWAGCLAAFLAMTYPPLTGLLHEYRPHAVLGAVLTLVVLLCVRLMERPSTGRMWMLSGGVTASALLHPSLFGLVSLPALIAVASLVLTRRQARRRTLTNGRPAVAVSLLRDPCILHGALPSWFLGGAVIALWYGRQGFAILKQYAINRRSDVVYSDFLRGLSGNSPADESVFWYLRTAAAALSLPLALLGAVGLLWALLRPRRLRWLILLTLIWTATLIAIGETSYSWWKMSTALPLVALLSALAIDSVRQTLLRRSLIAVACTVAAFNLAYVLFGGDWGDSIARRIGAQVESESCLRRARRTTLLCAQAPRPEAWPAEALVSAVRRSVAVDGLMRRNFVVAGGPRIVPQMFSYWLNRYWPGHRLRVRGLGNRTWGGGYEVRALLLAGIIVDAPRPVRPRHGNFIAATQRLLGKPPPPFRRAWTTVGTFAIPADSRYKGLENLRVLKRVKDVTYEEAQAVIAALELPKERLGKAEKLLGKLRAGPADPEVEPAVKPMR